jgi:Lrp/AsnC family transcriptional regulator for asnA, asnC and gidA
MPTSDFSGVDELDLAILKHLQDDGRRSFTEIAACLNVAVGTVRNRLKRLLTDETVRIVPRINPHRVGFHAPATILISIEPTLRETAIAEIAGFPEVSWLASLTGEYDVVVDVMCRDIDHLDEFLNKRLARVPGVKATQTALYLRIYKIALPDLDLLSSQPELSRSMATTRSGH